jgi:hypothetical protein
MTLNNNKQDPSAIHQCLGYAVFADAGVPAPRCNFAHVVSATQPVPARDAASASAAACAASGVESLREVIRAPTSKSRSRGEV